MDQRRHDKSLRLQVSVRQVYTGDGRMTGEVRVFCPDRDELVDVEACTSCPKWRAIYLEADERASYVECSPRSDRCAGVCGRDQIASIMTSNVICMRPDLSVQAALDIFLERNIGAAPVVGLDGRLLGVISRSDLLAAKNLAIDVQDPERLADCVEDVMTPFAFALQETAAVSQAAGLMASEGVHRLLVVSSRGELVGILSALDVMRWLAERDGYLSSPGRSDEVAKDQKENR